MAFGGLALDNANYTLSIQGNTAATISAKALSMSGLGVATSKTYDATRTATVSGTPTLATAEAVGVGSTVDGIAYNSDIVFITGTATGTYNTKDVATASTVAFGGLALDNANYTLTPQANTAATITAKALSMSGLSVASSKTYDATRTAGVFGTPVLATTEAMGTGTTVDGIA